MKKTIFIEGMSCGHCAAHVEEALKEVSGVSAAAVDLKKKLAVVSLTDAVEDGVLKAAVEEAGYEVSGMEG